ncbi:MAG: CPBP family intramembrane metalloprotease [Bacillota bacterium]|nr:CPBP family intramembrane metalloprotease [Bacillota bacterium]
MNNLKKALKGLSENFIFQGFLVIIFFLPLIATLGQYFNSGFINKTNKFLILFWPGVKVNYGITVPVWVTMGLMALSYTIGIIYLCRKKVFGKVAIWGIISMALPHLLGNIVNHFTGWRELQSTDIMHLTGLVDRMIFSLWQNPLWEEVVFRGIPLVILILMKKNLSERAFNLGKWIYIIIPSIIFAAYHVPNHGPSRIVDTVLSGGIFAWLALEYSFFAPLVLHYIVDAMMVVNMGQMKGIPTSEVIWLSQNHSTLNTVFSISILGLIVSIPIITIANIVKNSRKQKDCAI